jgi:gliding motility-associated lipoprotein GldH
MTFNKTFGILLMAICFLSACNDNVVYSENQELSANYEWKKSDKKTFTLPIHDNTDPYEFVLHFRYASGYQYKEVLMKMTETTPQGNKVTRDIQFNVVDDKGEFIGDKGYDIIDIDYVIDESKKFPIHGDYKYEIVQAMPEIDPLNFAMEVGLELRKKKK